MSMNLFPDPVAGALLENLGDAALLFDSRGRLQGGNEAARELYADASRGGALPLGCEMGELFAEEVAALRCERLGAVLETGAAQCFVDEDGARVLQHTLAPLKNGEKAGGGVLLLSRDVTLLHMQDIELRRELQRQIFYLESLPGYVMLLRPDGEIVYVNRCFKQYFGRSGFRKCQELLLDAYDGPEEASPGVCPPHEILEAATPGQWEWRHPDGRMFQCHARPMSDGEGGLVLLVLGMDVTAHKQAEAALQQALEYRKAILDAIPDLVWLKDGENRFVAVNKAYVGACGLSQELLAGGDHLQAWAADQGGRLQERDLQVLQTGQRTTDEEELEDAHGELRWFEAVRVPIFDSSGRPLGLAGIARDITERKLAVDMLLYSHAEMEGYVQERTARLRETVQQLVREVEERRRTEKDLEKARRNAEVATRAKSLFLANMSHEIRTPLNVIVTMADLALRDANALERTRALEMVQEAGGTLLHVINDILDFSKIEARKLELQCVAFDLPRTLQGIWDIHSIQARNKGLETGFEVAPDVPRAVMGDPVRLRQVLGNLLANAVKFTREGRVELGVHTVPESPGSVCFEVRDTGMGLNPEQRQLVFESFQQADNAITREYGGTGLGLAIVKRLVELMGGQVGLESAVGRGSVFRVTVPFESADAEAMGRQAQEALDRDIPQLPTMRVLLVEDNPLNRELISAFLKSQHHDVIEAGDGLQALETLQFQPVDLVLMDIQMPMLDGVATTQTIRSASSLAVPQDVPVVALTAHALSGDRERFLAAGLDGYVSKPVDLVMLQKEMARVVLARQERGEGRAGSASRADAAAAVQTQRARQKEPEAGAEPPAGLAGREQALAMLQGNEPLLLRLDAHFLRDAPVESQALGAALEAGDLARVKDLAHSLKGQAATIGAERAAFLARSLEGAVAAQDAGLLPGLYARLQEEVAAVLELVRELAQAAAGPGGQGPAGAGDGD